MTDESVTLKVTESEYQQILSGLQAGYLEAMTLSYSWGERHRNDIAEGWVGEADKFVCLSDKLIAQHLGF